MAKYSEKEIEIHKQFLTIADMKAVANKGVVWQTLRNALYGINHYDTGSDAKQKALKELKDLIRTRAINAMEVVGVKRVEG